MVGEPERHVLLDQLALAVLGLRDGIELHRDAGVAERCLQYGGRGAERRFLLGDVGDPERIGEGLQALALGITGLGEVGAGLLGILGVLHRGLVVARIGGRDHPRPLARLAEIAGRDDLVVGHGVGQRLAHGQIVVGRHLVIHVEEEVLVAVGADHLDVVHLAQAVVFLGRQSLRDLRPSRLQDRDAVRALRHLSQHHPVVCGRAAVVVWIRHHVEAGALVPAIEAPGPEARRIHVVVVGVAPGVLLGRVGFHGLLVVDVEAEDREHAEEELVRPRLADLDRVVVDLLDLVAERPRRSTRLVLREDGGCKARDRADVGEEPADRRGPAHRLGAGEGVDHVIGVEGGAVAALDALTQREGPGEGFGVVGPGFREPALELVEVEQLHAFLVHLPVGVVDQGLQQVRDAAVCRDQRGRRPVVVETGGNVVRQDQQVLGLRRSGHADGSHESNEQAMQP